MAKFVPDTVVHGMIKVEFTEMAEQDVAIVHRPEAEFQLQGNVLDDVSKHWKTEVCCSQMFLFLHNPLVKSTIQPVAKLVPAADAHGPVKVLFTVMLAQLVAAAHDGVAAEFQLQGVAIEEIPMHIFTDVEPVVKYCKSVQVAGI